VPDLPSLECLAGGLPAGGSTSSAHGRRL